MKWWRIEHMKTHQVADAPGSTFGEACAHLGWDWNGCKVLRVWS